MSYHLLSSLHIPSLPSPLLRTPHALGKRYFAIARAGSDGHSFSFSKLNDSPQGNMQGTYVHYLLSYFVYTTWGENRFSVNIGNGYSVYCIPLCTEFDCLLCYDPSSVLLLFCHLISNPSYEATAAMYCLFLPVPSYHSCSVCYLYVHPVIKLYVTVNLNHDMQNISNSSLQ